MARRHPPLDPEKAKKVKEAIRANPKLTATELRKDFPDIPIIQIHGYRINILREQKIRSKIEKEQKPPKDTDKPPDKKPELTKPKPREVAKMPIEQVDLLKIQEMIDGATTKAVEGAVAQATKVAGETTRTVLKEHDEAKKKGEEATRKQEEDVRLKAQMEDYCKKFPDLCKEVASLKELVKSKGETHETTKEYLECKECGSKLLNTLARMSKEDKGLAERLADAFKKGDAIGALKEAIVETEKKPKEKENPDSLF